MPSSHAWIFQATPHSLDLAAELRTGESLSWSVTRYARQVRPGQRAYYWQAGRDAGIYGLGRVEEVPARDATGRYTVRTRHERALFAPVTRAELRADPTLRDLAVLRQPRGTIFPLTPAQDVALAQRTGAGGLVLAAPATRRAAGKLRLRADDDGDLPARVEAAMGRGGDVVVLVVADGAVAESVRVTAVRRRRNHNLELRLAPLPGYVPPSLPSDAVARVAAGHAVDVTWPQVATDTAWLQAAPPGEEGEPPATGRVEERTPPRPVRVEEGPPRQARVEEGPLPYQAAPRFAPPLEEVRGDLVLPEALPAQLVAAVNAGNHIVLMGAPGTGKTALALQLAHAAARAGLCAGPLLTTATADWTTFDTVGGLVPASDGSLRFAEGVALRALRENRWLVLDELNRADIDKAFGPLLTVLSGGPVDLPAVTVGGRPVRIAPSPGPSGVSDDGATYFVGRAWRIVATMNTRDRAALFSFSLAFARRFAFVLVPAPDPAALLALVQQRVALERPALELLERLLRVAPRTLGPAIVLDAASYIAARAGPDALVEALGAFVLPQFEGLDQESVVALAQELAPALGPGGAAALLEYVRALYGEG